MQHCWHYSLLRLFVLYERLILKHRDSGRLQEVVPLMKTRASSSSSSSLNTDCCLAVNRRLPHEVRDSFHHCFTLMWWWWWWWGGGETLWSEVTETRTLFKCSSKFNSSFVEKGFNNKQHLFTNNNNQYWLVESLITVLLHGFVK